MTTEERIKLSEERRNAAIAWAYGEEQYLSLDDIVDVAAQIDFRLPQIFHHHFKSTEHLNKISAYGAWNVLLNVLERFAVQVRVKFKICPNCGSTDITFVHDMQMSYCENCTCLFNGQGTKLFQGRQSWT